MLKKKERRPPIAEINITPFVDVLLVLVVILLIASPFLQRQIRLDLPKERIQQRNYKADTQLILSINKQGTLYLGTQKYGEEKLVNQLALVLQKEPDKRIYIRADKNVRYEQLTHLMSQIKAVGAQKIGLLVDEKQ